MSAWVTFRRLALAASVVATSVVTLHAGDALAISSRNGGLSEVPAAADGRGVLAYEAVVGQQRTPTGTQIMSSACTASVVNLPGLGPRIVTARHCDGHDPVIFDERTRVKPAARHQLDAGPDVATFDLPKAAAAFPVFETRSSATLQRGETLCAFHVKRVDGGGLSRDKICGAFVGRTMRFDGGGEPRLVVSHPFEHGTSGSPLFDASGRVVGVVVSTTAEEGFAEPIEEAGRVAVASPIPTGQNPPKAQPATPWRLPSFLPREGSVCLPGFCFRWEV